MAARKSALLGTWILGLAVTALAGCALSPPQPYSRNQAQCPRDHTLSCPVAHRQGQVIMADCVCVRNTDMQALFRKY